MLRSILPLFVNLTCWLNKIWTWIPVWSRYLSNKQSVKHSWPRSAHNVEGDLIGDLFCLFRCIVMPLAMQLAKFCQTQKGVTGTLMKKKKKKEMQSFVWPCRNLVLLLSLFLTASLQTSSQKIMKVKHVKDSELPLKWGVYSHLAWQGGSKGEFSQQQTLK